MTTNPYFTEQLRKLRSEAGLTQKALARLASIPLRTLQQWEQGNAAPVSPSFFRLVVALGVSADEFAPPVQRPKHRRGGRSKQ